MQSKARFRAILSFGSGTSAEFSQLRCVHFRYQSDGTGVAEGGEYRLPDEIGSISDSPEGLGQFLIHLKGDYLFLSLTRAGHVAPPPSSVSAADSNTKQYHKPFAA